MLSKYLKFLLLFFLTIIAVLIYLEFNESYKLSIESKLFYALGDYNTSYELSDQALRLQEYNTMALHIKNRSKASIEIVEFLKESEEFEIEIKNTLAKTNLTKGEMSKIKMMTDVIINRYLNLNKVFIEDDNLLNSAKTQYLKFQKLNHEITTNAK